jgi:carbonic anhydrase
LDRVLTPVKAKEDIFPKWQGTPIGDLLAYHNLRRPYRTYDKAVLLVAMCMDHRKALQIPDRFAYILRTGGGNPNRVLFEISFGVALGGVRALALIAHDDCGMVGLSARRDDFVQGLILEGWPREEAEAHFDTNAPLCEVPDSIEFVVTEAERLQKRYPDLTVAPLFYSTEEGLLYQI